MDNKKQLRIACLIPSATDICVHLGLAESVVGITHECRRDGLSTSSVQILTANGLLALGTTSNKSVSSQADIHEAVQQQSLDAKATCATIPSLYPLLEDAFRAAKPSLVLTQDLCKVCAPSSDSVKTLLKSGEKNNNDEVDIVSLTPESLEEVIETFSVVAAACGVPERGQLMESAFRANLAQLKQIIVGASSKISNTRPPRMLLLEWMDPPFDAGHWMPNMMTVVQVQNAMLKTDTKSKPVCWKDIKAADPDVVLIACCGFGLDRNVQDTLAAADAIRNACPRAVQANRVFSCDGDSYFANPGPNLLLGTAIMGLTAYHDCPAVVQAIRALSFVPDQFEGYRQVDLRNPADTPGTNVEAGPAVIADIEDFDMLHQAACQAGHLSYKDPATGYSVFSELAHKARGKCCGSGCRHCPFAHENVKDKASKIQQPAFLYKASGENSLFDVNHGNVRVLFFSGGKDSFLTIRALVREAAASHSSKFGLVLLTTFDATSRIIAHQDASIDTIVKQASHLDISIIGVPMHRGSSQTYVQRVQCALTVIETSLTDSNKIEALVFGDLHLEHIKGWRDDQLGSLGYELLYPLFNVPYSTLEVDLEASRVPCQVSGSTVESVAVGEMYSREFRQRMAANTTPSIDVFGENGEFHTVAQVWEVERVVALSLDEVSS